MLPPFELSLLIFSALTLFMTLSLIYFLFNPKDKQDIKKKGHIPALIFSKIRLNLNATKDKFDKLNLLPLPGAIFSIEQKKFIKFNDLFLTEFHNFQENLQNFSFFTDSLPINYKIEKKGNENLFFLFEYPPNNKVYEVFISRIDQYHCLLVFVEKKIKNDFEFKLFKASIDNSIEGIAYLDSSSNIVYSNKNFYKIFEIELNEDVYKKNFFDLFDTENKLIEKSSFITNFQKKNFPEVQEKKVILLNGSVKWIKIFYAFFEVDNKEFLKLSIIDITYEKTYLEKIRDDLTYQYFFLDVFPLPIWKSDLNGNRFYINKSYISFFKTSKEKELGQTWRENIEEFYLINFNIKFRYVAHYKENQEIIYKRKIESEEKWIKEIIAPTYNRQGNVNGLLGICIDITLEKKYERQLIETNQLLQNIIDKSVNGIVLIDSDNKILEWNDFLAQISSIKKEDLINLKVNEAFTIITNKIRLLGDSLERALKLFEAIASNSLKNLLHIDNLIEFITYDGVKRFAKIFPKIIKLENKTLYAFFIIDYTNEKEALELASINQKKYNDLFLNSSDSIVFINSKLEILDCNPAFLTLIQEHDKSLLIGRNLGDLLLNSSENQTCIKNFNEPDLNRRLIYKIARKPGDLRYVDTLFQKFDEGSYICLIRDITNILEQQHKLETLLKEKEVLIKEVHHRVKNNLQIISSLLNLQSMEIENEELKNKFLESQARIKTMSMIHEFFYSRDEMNSINLKEYLTSLGNYLYSLYEINYDKIKVKYNLEDIEVSIDKAITLGLLTNEILTNAFKYAFPQDQKGIIEINLEKINDKQVSLKIKDNGIGLPTNINAKKQSLGLQLIDALVKQLKATFDLKTNNGCQYSIVFEYNTEN